MKDIVELLNKLLARGNVTMSGERRAEPYPVWLVTHTDTSRGVGTPEYREIVTRHGGRDLGEVLHAVVTEVYRP